MKADAANTGLSLDEEDTEMLDTHPPELGRSLSPNDQAMLGAEELQNRDKAHMMHCIQETLVDEPYSKYGAQEQFGMKSTQLYVAILPREQAIIFMDNRDNNTMFLDKNFHWIPQVTV